MKTFYLLLFASSLWSQVLLNETFDNFINLGGAGDWVFDSTYHTEVIGNSSQAAIKSDLSGNLNTLTRGGWANDAAMIDSLVGNSVLYNGGNALRFNGSTPHYFTISNPDEADFDVGDQSTGVDFAIEVWVSFTSTASMVPVAKRSSNPGYNITFIDSRAYGVVADGTNFFQNYYSANTAGERFNSSNTPGGWAHLVVNFDRDGVSTGYKNGVALTTTNSMASIANTLSSSFNFNIGFFNTPAVNPFTGYIARVKFHRNLLTLKQIKESAFLASGWASHSGGVTRSLWGFNQGVVSDTIYYNTPLTTGTWSISISDSAASAVTYNVLTSTDKTNWTQIGTDATSTTWGVSTFEGTGQGYFAIAVPSGTAYFDNVTITNTPSGQDKGFKEYQKFNGFKSFTRGSGASVSSPSTPALSYVLKDSSGITPNADRYLAYNTANYTGSNFTAGASYTLKRANVNLKKLGSPTVGIIAQLWSDNAGNPSTLLASATDSVNSASLTTDYQSIAFDFDGVSIVSGTSYWLVLYGLNGTSPGNYPLVNYNNATTDYLKYSTDGSSWSNADASASIYFKLYAYE